MSILGEEGALPPCPVSSGADPDVPGKRKARMMACSALPGEPSPDTLILPTPAIPENPAPAVFPGLRSAEPDVSVCWPAWSPPAPAQAKQR